MIRVDINDADARKLLNELRGRMRDMTPVMDAVGAVYASGAQQRFVDQVDPDGRPWEPLSPVTLAGRRKRGKGAQILRDTGRLMNSISYSTAGNTVTVFTNVAYGATHQYGLRGIPQRRFLGQNKGDDQAVLEVLQGYLQADQSLSWFERLAQQLAGRRR